jgi:hypothetical protein
MSTEAFTHDVFLSHSAKAKAVVRPLAEWLRKDGLEVWPCPPKPLGEGGFDGWVLKAGDSMPAKIEEGLEHSKLGTRNSELHSPACRRVRSARTRRSWPVRP